MPKFYSLEQPSKEKKEELVKELHEYPELKPRLTFTFPLNKNRRNALEMIKSEKIDEEKVIKLLESDDFVEQRAGLYLLGQISNFSEKGSKKVLSILERMSRDKNWDIREEVIQTLGNCGEKALPLLEKMSRNEHEYIRERVARALGDLGEKAVPLLEQMSQDENRPVRQAVLLALDNFGEEALPLLEKMSQDKGYSDMQRFIAQTKARIKIKTIIKTSGEKALPLLEKMSQDEDRIVRESVAQGLADFGTKALPLLEKMSQDEDQIVVRAAVQTRVKIIVENFGTKALPLLEKMSQDRDWRVQQSAVWALADFGEKFSSLLTKLKQNKRYPVAKVAARQILEGLKSRRWLLSTRKPLFATPHIKSLAEKILKLEIISQELKNRFKDKFIGFTIFGSTAKGYSQEESDLDWAIIARNKKVSKYFKKLAGPLNLCFEHYTSVDKKDRVREDPDVLFYGLFFGNRQRLLELQKKTLKNLDGKEWDKIRKKIMENEINVEKAAERAGIAEDLEELKQFIALLRVPPSHQETLKIVQKRIK